STDGGYELVAAGGERVAHGADVLASGLGERRTPAPTATDDRTELADDCDRVETGEGLVEVHDERDLAVVCGREHDGHRVLALAHLIGEVAQRTSGRSGHLRDEDSVLLVLPHDLGTGGLRLWLLRLSLELLDLGAHSIEL